MAQAEIQALCPEKPKSFKRVDNVVICDTDFMFPRLALTKKVYDFLFEATSKNLNEKMKKFDWNEIYDKNFSLKITNAGSIKFYEKEATLAKHIWNQVHEPRVDLKFAQTKIEIILTEKKIFVGKLIYETITNFRMRRSHLRPAPHPTSIHPKLARACINLTGLPRGKILCDPFCGSGGILLEAGLMRFKTVGFDIDDGLLELAEKNLDAFKAKGFRLEKHDSTKLPEDVDYVTTDLPYGRSSKITKKLKLLYTDFLKSLEQNLKYKAVIIFPDFIDHKPLIAKTNFKIEKEFSWYIHKSLTRNIGLLSKK